MSVAWTTSQTLDAPGHGRPRDGSYRGRLYRNRSAVTTGWLCRRVAVLVKSRTEKPGRAAPAGIRAAWALDGLWTRLGIGREMRRLLKGRRLDDSAERVLFALAANRALAPSSKLAAARWANEDVMIAGLPVTSTASAHVKPGAGDLARWVVEFPGDHSGFVALPEQFGSVLHQVLAETA